MPALALAAVALGVAWLPWETFPWTAPAAAAAVLGLLPWAWARWRPPRVTPPAAALGVAWLVAALAVARDREAALAQLGLAAAAGATAWISARRREPRVEILVAAGLAALSLWALYQVVWGFARAETGLGALPESLRAAAAYRLATRRPFAGLALPGHLAAVLVTALPLLWRQARRGRWRPVWVTLLLLDGVALALTRSLLGAALAALLLLAAAPARLRGRAAVAAMALVAAAALVRPDLVRLEPLVMRLDNWRAALWVWWQHPWLGVGPGGLGQAAQSVPFPLRSVSAYAHSLPLQAAAELGLPGLAVVTLGAVALVRLLRRGWSREPELVLAVTVVPLHNLMDFSLHVSGVAVPWAALLGQLAAAVRSGSGAAPASPARGRPAAVAAVALVLGVTFLGAASRTLEETAAAAGDPATALRAARLAPWRCGPPLLAAALAEREGDHGLLVAARRTLATARRIRPGSAALELAAARLDLAAGDLVTASAAVERARELRPGWEPAERLAASIRRWLEGR